MSVVSIPEYVLNSAAYAVIALAYERVPEDMRKDHYVGTDSHQAVVDIMVRALDIHNLNK